MPTTAPPPGGMHFNVTPQEIADAATSVGNAAGTITDQLAAIKTFVVSLEGSWHGFAATTFQSLMTDYDIFARMLTQALTDISSGLRGNYVNYTQSEQQNIANLQAVAGSIPGANFA